MHFTTDKHRGFAALAALLALAACGGDPPPPRSLALADYCVELGDAFCATGARCGCGDPMCTTTVGGRCPLREGSALRLAVDDGTVAYDGVAAARFVDRARATSCSERASDCGTTDVCFALSSEGGPCGTNHGCADGLECVSGTCAIRAPAELGLGAPCTLDSECTTMRCDFASGRCADLLPEGSLCVRHGECDTDYCDRDSDISAGNCRIRQPLGAPCDEPAMCIDNACASSICILAACLDAA